MSVTRNSRCPLGCAVCTGDERSLHHPEMPPAPGEADYKLFIFLKIITIGARTSERAESPVGALQEPRIAESLSQGRALVEAGLEVRDSKASGHSQGGASGDPWPPPFQQASPSFLSFFFTAELQLTCGSPRVAHAGWLTWLDK